MAFLSLFCSRQLLACYPAAYYRSPHGHIARRYAKLLSRPISRRATSRSISESVSDAPNQKRARRAAVRPDSRKYIVPWPTPYLRESQLRQYRV
eukprot:1034852-Rhodomonas_salina.1